MPVPPAVVRRLSVTVRAEERDVLEPVVVPIPVDVVQCHVQRFSLPLRYPAPLAAILLEPGVKKPLLQMTAVRLRTVGHKEGVDRHGSVTCYDRTALDSRMPAAEVEAKASGAPPDAEPGVVRTLYLSPVVAPSKTVIDGYLESARVVHDRRLRHAEAPRDLTLRQSFVEQVSHRRAHDARRQLRSGPTSVFSHEQMFAWRPDGKQPRTAARRSNRTATVSIFEPKTLGIQGSNLGFQDQNLAGFHLPQSPRRAKTIAADEG